MHLVSIRFQRMYAFAAVAVLGMFALAAGPASAQVGAGPPGIDHYLVYRASIVPGPYFVDLLDQFSAPNYVSHFVNPMEYFANPVSKSQEGIVDTTLHYTWWRIDLQPYNGSVLATNQFGDQPLQLGPAEYLWNPALKNVPPQPGLQPPFANHYKCYRATGVFQPRTVELQDQFGLFAATVLYPEWFCNPAEKIYTSSDGTTRFDPIVRPDAHQVCYRIQPLTPYQPRSITFLDEFRFGNTFLPEQVWLCVPTLKHEIVGADVSSWGSVKAIYR